MKKFIVLIIDSDAEPIYSLGREIWRNSARKYNFEIYFLRSEKNYSNDSIVVDGDTIYCRWIENFSERLIYKTLKGFEYCLQNSRCKYVLRTNLSSFFNIPLFQVYCESAPETSLYAGPLESYPLTLPNGVSGTLLFCSGSGYLLSRDLVELTLQRSGDISRSLLDDVWLGTTLMDINRKRWVRCDLTNINNNEEHTAKSIFNEIKISAQQNIFHFRINNSKKSLPREILDKVGWEALQNYFIN